MNQDEKEYRIFCIIRRIKEEMTGLIESEIDQIEEILNEEL